MNRDTFFRANTGAVILNSQRQVLAFERKDFADSWQFPQGGIDKGEPPFETVKREIEEETGLNADRDLSFLGEHSEWLAYELPESMRGKKSGRGQVQKWFFFEVIDDEIVIDLEKAKDEEFANWRWMEMERLVQIVIPFRQGVYARLQDWVEENLS